MDVKITSVIERAIAFFAPHWCIVCSAENNVLCEACRHDVFIELDSFCALCGRPTVDWRVCQHCSKTGAQRIWVAAEYTGVPAELLRRFKFERLKAAYEPLAASIDVLLPYLDADTLVVPLPTAPRRVRQRGYDQSLLLARHIARLKGLRVATPLLHVGDSRQVGASRQQRLTQASSAYRLKNDINLKNAHILLIDDICTTGASLTAAIKLFKRAGAAHINAAVVARQRPKG